MEAIKFLVTIPEGRQITVQVPSHIPTNQAAELILMVKSPSADRAAKIETMKGAMQDELFVEDLRQISRDFSTVDLHDWP